MSAEQEPSKSKRDKVASGNSKVAPAKAAKRGATFGLCLGTMFVDAFKTYAANVVPLSLASLAAWAAYAVFRYPAQQLFVDGKVFQSVGVDLVGLLVAGVVAIPWYHYSLAAVDGRPISLGEPFQNLRIFGYQAVASFWFWAGILLGLRYLFGIPSLFVILLYSFHGFVIVDGAAKGGMLSLGQSVRLTEGRRAGLFAIGGLLFFFNLFGAFGIGLENTVLGVDIGLPVAVIGVTITSSVTMLAGAALYRLCDSDLPEAAPPKKIERKPRQSRLAKRSKKAKAKRDAARVTPPFDKKLVAKTKRTGAKSKNTANNKSAKKSAQRAKKKGES